MSKADYEMLENACSSGNPKANASLPSLLSFWWMNEIMRTGNKRQLQNEDLFPLCDEDETQLNTENLTQQWTLESAIKDERWRLLKALFKSLPIGDYVFVVSSSLLSAVCQTVQPLFLSFLVTEIMNSSDQPTKWAYLYGVGICMSSMIRQTATQQFALNSSLMSMRWKVATKGLVFNKVSCRSVAYHAVTFTFE